MDQEINEVKSVLFNRDVDVDLQGKLYPPRADGSKIDVTPSMWISVLNSMGLAHKILHTDEVAAKFSITNARVYGGMQQIEGINGDCGPPKPQYATKYSSWMEEYLKTQGSFKLRRMKASPDNALTCLTQAQKSRMHITRLSQLNCLRPL